MNLKKKRSNVKPCGDKFKHFEGFHKRKNQKNKTQQRHTDCKMWHI